ncbi:RING-type E3 ubiquitin transferase [Sarracenia purpurea var. burkii]
MAFEQYFTQEWQSISSTKAEEPENISGCFDCNICLDFAHDPVVTFCGHLYCWPCIYKWFRFESASLASNERQKCPVCKAKISHTTLVPLYGQGHSPNYEPDLKPKSESLSGMMTIPPRPTACGTQPSHHQRYSHHPYESYEEEFSSQPSFSLISGNTTTGVFNPVAGTVVGMFGKMVYSQVFGNSESLYAYPNSYHLMGSSSPRLRRREMQADKSLNRISIFLFCCFLLCLLLF